MGIITVLLLGVSLSADAFAVSVCKGLACRKLKTKYCVIVGLWFGIFQGIMPLLGYLLGSAISKYITAVAPWVAFVLLGIIGGNMIREAVNEARDPDEDKEYEDMNLGFTEMLLLAIATSIDAMAVGITFAVMDVSLSSALGKTANVILACAIIACCTFVISGLGVVIGNIFGVKYKNKAQVAGGVILILIGLRILIAHFL